MKPVFLYALHSGNLYGTERMALTTLEGLSDSFDAVLFAPPGPVLEYAARQGITTVPFVNGLQFALRIMPFIARDRYIAFAATGVIHSMVFLAWNMLFRRRAIHLHLVHGGTDERDSYGRKKLLNRWPVTLVAVSNFVRERLIANGVESEKIVVVENFLPEKQIDSVPRRQPFAKAGISNVVIVSRVDPIKRIDLLFDALERHPELGKLNFRVLGAGWDLQKLRERATVNRLNIKLEGFCSNVPEILANSDLLLHLCPVEPFGLAILEAMAAGIPVLLPDQGGAAGLIETEVSGFLFRADDAEDLAGALDRIQQIPAARLNDVATAAIERLHKRYSEHVRLNDYRRLLEPLRHD